MVRAIPLVGWPGLIRKCRSIFPRVVTLVSNWSGMMERTLSFLGRPGNLLVLIYKLH